MNTTQRIQGIVPPLITPLLGPDRLDLAGLERLVEHMLAGGVHGFFILGTTGEGPSHPYTLRREVIAAVVRLVAGRVPVIAVVTDSAAEESVALARFAADAGATAVAIALPYYFPIGQADVRAYLAAIIPRLALPVLLYNIPSHVKLQIELPTIKVLLDSPHVIGIKDSSGDLTYFSGVLALAAARPDWSVLIGSEVHLADAVMAGAAGAIPSGANVHPRLYVRQYEAAKSRDTATIERLNEEIKELHTKLYCVGSDSPGAIKGIKFALSHLGICSEVLAEPLHPCGEESRAIIRDYVEKIRR